MPQIYPKKIKKNVYYYYQHTYRVKIDASQSGKKKGSGKSKVRTNSIYLGTAESIFQRLSKAKEPVEVYYREFGLLAAGYKAAEKIGLIDALKKYIPGQRYGIKRWIFFLVTILNRLDSATSKEKMGRWASKTILPQLLNFDADVLNSKTFWYVTDDIISEKELKTRRESNPELEEDLCVGLETEIFKAIEQEIWPQLNILLGESIHALAYDTSNFYTYIEEPVASWLAKTGNNKSSKHHLKQVGLLMVVEKIWGIPLFFEFYRGNSQDSKTFSSILTKLLKRIKECVFEVDELVLILDKGNNSKKNFENLKDQINWVGSLSPSNQKDLISKDLSEYAGRYGKYRYYRTTKKVMGIECAVIVTFNKDLYKKQKYSLRNGIKKLKKNIQDKFESYKKQPKTLTKGMESMRKKNRYGKYIKLEIEHGRLIFHEQTSNIEEKMIFLGKNIVFSDKIEAESSWIISQYKEKDIIEDDFKILRNPLIIRFIPIRHWTDTKIYAFGFSCIMSLILIKVMQIQAAKIGLKMSPDVLTEELKDIKEVIMVYSKNEAARKTSRKSSVQQKLWDLYELAELEDQLTIH